MSGGPMSAGEAPFGRALVGGHLERLELLPEGALVTAGGREVRADEVTWLPPIEPRTILALALNYRDHAAELDLAEPEQPALFPKFRNALLGHGGKIVRPAGIEYMHYETELAVVIGRPARGVSEADALAHVKGYTIANDLVVRDFVIDHFRPPVKPKNFDTFLPLGPLLTPASLVPDPQALALRTYVNDELRQEGHTSAMLRGVAELIAYVSEFMTLQEDDVLLTGTPKGISHVVAGDVIRCEVGDFMPLVNAVVAEEDLAPGSRQALASGGAHR